jgi:hypothetical protein
VDKFDAMQMFVRVIEKGSFSAVAKERFCVKTLQWLASFVRTHAWRGAKS